MSPPTPLALLVCDTPIPSVLSNHGTYHTIFHKLLSDSYPFPHKPSVVRTREPEVGTAVEEPRVERPILEVPTQEPNEEGLKSILKTPSPSRPSLDLEEDAGPFVLDAYNVFDGEYPSEDEVDRYKGILISGSAASAYENVDWINALIDYVGTIAKTKPAIKLIGICFGHQIIARALSGTCVPNSGRWEVGPTSVDLSDVGREVFGVGRFNIEQFHRDHVPSVPPHFEAIGSTGLTPNQGMVLFYRREGGTALVREESGGSMEKGNSGASANGNTRALTNGTSKSDTSPRRSLNDIQILTLQGHPEFTDGIVEHIIEARASVGVLDKPTTEDARRRVGEGWRNDGVGVIGRVIWGVLGVEV
ncbi:hypothetical protein JAAARDRAFT_40738 [Jaapia argillacea MUCL 33604]|uniref:Glutamine amidotransferase domain-containing protein n=1 Tax=Jaapia argillacea MUCL 33604 TaxID=933084 RepID=A0A067PAH2_9AGAM|nr:hypothetical protein JAAARDRAFT_40738 [Jaapia argillacea MUCL 33604]